MIEIVDRGCDAAAHLGLGCQGRGALQREANREDTLDDLVLKVGGNAVAVLQHGQLAEATL